MTMTTQAQRDAAPTVCVTDLIVVVPTSELSAAVDELTSGTSITTFGPSGAASGQSSMNAFDNRRREPLCRWTDITDLNGRSAR